MQRIVVLACLVTLAAAGLVDHSWIQGGGRDRNSDRLDRDILTRDDLLKQKFLLEVLLRVSEPLRDSHLLSLGTSLVLDESKYIGNVDEEMRRIMELCRQGRILGHDSICTVAEDEHLRQLNGLYRLLVRSGNWDTFQRNVLYMRQHVKDVLFVNALLLALADRDDTRHLIVPAIHEILPELYANHELLRQVNGIDLSHLVGLSGTRNPDLMDLVGAGRRMGEQGRGRQGLRGGENSIRSGDKIVLTVRDSVEDILTEDVGLKSWLHVLVNDLSQREGEALSRRVGSQGRLNSMDGGRERVWDQGVHIDDRRAGSIIGGGSMVRGWSRRNDYGDMMMGGRGMTGGRSVRLDDTLPTTDIRSSRLVHVSPRWMNRGADIEREEGDRLRMNAIRGSGIRDGRHTDRRNGRGEDTDDTIHQGINSRVRSDWSRNGNEDRVTWRDNSNPLWRNRISGIDNDRSMEWNVDRGMNDIGMNGRSNRGNMNILRGSDRWEGGRDDTLMLDDILVGDSNMGIRRDQRRLSRSVDRIDDLSMTRGRIDETESGLVALHNLQQLIARLNIDRMAQGITGTEDIDRNPIRSQRLNNARLDSRERTVLRMNEMRWSNRNNRNLIERINQIESQLQSAVQREVQRIAGMHQSSGIQVERNINRVLGDILMGNVEGVGIMHLICQVLVETEELHGIQKLVHLGVLPLQDPVILHLLTRLVRIIDESRLEVLGALNLEELQLTGVTIDDVQVDQLRTHIDTSDSDLINLVDPRLTIAGDRVRGMVVGRQQRLNHKEFNIRVDITANRNRRVLMRTFLVPRLNGIDIETQRLNALLLDTTVLDLQMGRNSIKRSSRDIRWTAGDVTPMTEIYKAVMMALDGQISVADVRRNLVGQDCRFPHRLLLPRGTAQGLDMQLIVVVTPIEDTRGSINSGIGEIRGDLMCQIGVGTNILDGRPLMFPLDRRIDRIQSLMNASNVHVKDVIIRHDE